MTVIAETTTSAMTTTTEVKEQIICQRCQQSYTFHTPCCKMHTIEDYISLILPQWQQPICSNCHWWNCILNVAWSYTTDNQQRRASILTPVTHSLFIASFLICRMTAVALYACYNHKTEQ